MLILCALMLTWVSVSLRGDFYVKVPEFNPGDGAGGYDLFLPPWYPYDITEAKNYTVDEAGEMVERDPSDGLDNYGEKKTKVEQVKTEIRKDFEKLLFDKVIPAPKALVIEFYAHVPYMAYDVKDNPKVKDPSGRYVVTSLVMKVRPEYGGFPVIPVDNRIVMDAWTFATLCGWEFDWSGQYYGIKTWESGHLVPNLRELAVYYVTEGDACLKNALMLLERDRRPPQWNDKALMELRIKEDYNPGLSALKSMSGADHKKNAKKWLDEYVNPTWNKKHPKVEIKCDDWDSCVKTLVMEDLTRVRVPTVDAFHRLRDVPELSEQVFIKLLESGEASIIAKRNLAALLSGFSSPRAAKLLHGLTRDKDAVTALRAVTSLAKHPHGKVRQILLDWLNGDEEIRRAKAILMMGRADDSKMGDALIEYYPKAVDMQEKELLLRGLMRQAHPKARDLFVEGLKHPFEQIRYTSTLGLIALGDEAAPKTLEEVMDEAFKPRTGIVPGSGALLCQAPHLRFDVIDLAARGSVKVRKKLWNLIEAMRKDSAYGGEPTGAVPHLMTYALQELDLTGIFKNEKDQHLKLRRRAENLDVDISLRASALFRLYEVDPEKCLKYINIIIEQYLKGRKDPVSVQAHTTHPGWEQVDGKTPEELVQENDFLLTAIKISLIDNPLQDKLILRLMKSKNIPLRAKAEILDIVYARKKNFALKVINTGLKQLIEKDSGDLTPDETRLMIRMIRFAGVMRDKGLMQDIAKLIPRHLDPWVRFMAFYSLRQALETETYGDVITTNKTKRTELKVTLESEIKKARWK